MIDSLELLKTAHYKKKLDQCIHCGLCLEACPTYSIFRTEMDSPRGRITLIKAVSEDRVSLQDFKDSFTKHMLLCLACRSCESACPSGVEYGALIEEARIVVEQNRSLSLAERFLRYVGMQQMMPRLGLLKLVG